MDLDRPLTDDGAEHARAIRAWLTRADLVPDRVLLSPARRAVETWEGAAGGLEPKPDSIVEPRIFDNTIESLLAAIREVGDDVRTLAVVGHNPSIGELARALDDGQGSSTARAEIEVGFRAGGVAVFSVGAPFAALVPDAATLEDFAVPGG